MIHPIGQADHAQGRFGMLSPASAGKRGQMKREFHVLDSLKDRNQVVELED
jgi:hypothetical protein